jgi:hypothetical protein
MGWYRAVKGKLYTKRDTSKTAPEAAQPTSKTSASSAGSATPRSPPYNGGFAVSSTDAAHYEMKDNTIIVGPFTPCTLRVLH